MADRVLLVDAALDGSPPGTIRRLEADAVRERLRSTTHRLGVGAALGLAERWAACRAPVTIYTISGRWFGPGPASPEVVLAARMAARRIIRDEST